MARKSFRIMQQKRALSVLLILIILGFGTGIVRIGYLQIVKGDYYRAEAEKVQLRDTEISAQRGTIYDRNMEIVAQSASVWRVYINPSALTLKDIVKNKDAIVDNIAETLTEILDVTEDSVRDKASRTSYNYLTIKNKVEKPEKDKIDEFIKSYYEVPGSEGKKIYYSAIIGIDPDVKRYYPLSNFASSVVGFTGTDDDGLWGLEYQYNNELTGVPGRIVSAKNASVGSGAMTEQFETVHDAKQGNSLVLTIDSTIQKYLENSLQQCYENSRCSTAYGIVMDVKTGGILAMTTQSDYDLNNPYTLTDKKAIKEIEKITVDSDETNKKRASAVSTAQNAQWRNRAISDTYEPGSVYKVITMAAGLEENVVGYNDPFYCSGNTKIGDRTYYCHKRTGHGSEENLTVGLMNSCNPFFISIGQNLGVETFYEYFEAFGFTEKTGIDLPGEANPVAGTTYHALESMSKVNLASCSFGQSFQVTALQMITAISAIGNGGKLMTPYVVDKVIDQGGNIVSKTQPTVKRQVISESTAKKIIDSMESVATAGTAKNAYVAGYHVAGKTGTSDKLNNYGQYIASFACVAPADDPEIAVIIVVDEPQGLTGGGAVAAPVAAEVVENILTYLNVDPKYTQQEQSLVNISVPSVVNETVESASSTLEKSGFTVKVLGDGDRVIKQMPSYGQSIPQKGVIVLYTSEENTSQKASVPNFAGMTVAQANAAASSAGVNIKISGNISAGDITAWKQSVEKNKEVNYGSTITVFFSTNTGVSDH